ncbi:LysM peptidoglycan-binding domain-containing protein [Marinicrinis sediminis]|uniref:LysM peptidoglycan-binding domain-containing protein n=1 Tax=Marinicrinis sediminis TaxID=1652465 RepID=A0ABW5R5Z7_9BACL
MKIHIVKNGEHLAQLSEKYGIESERLLTYNPHVRDGLAPGMKVKIPAFSEQLVLTKSTQRARIQSTASSDRDSDDADSDAQDEELYAFESLDEEYDEHHQDEEADSEEEASAVKPKEKPSDKDQQEASDSSPGEGYATPPTSFYDFPWVLDGSQHRQQAPSFFSWAPAPLQPRAQSSHQPTGSEAGQSYSSYPVDHQFPMQANPPGHPVYPFTAPPGTGGPGQPPSVPNFMMPPTPQPIHEWSWAPGYAPHHPSQSPFNQEEEGAAESEGEEEHSAHKSKDAKGKKSGKTSKLSSSEKKPHRKSKAKKNWHIRTDLIDQDRKRKASQPWMNI